MLAFARLCTVSLLVFWCLDSSESSSIYVGRHEAATIPESQTSETVHVVPQAFCMDSNKRLCRKIVKVYGSGVCSTSHRALRQTVQSICQETCGFCQHDCEDQFEDLCIDYAYECTTEGDLGKLMKEMCPKTCGSCQLRPHKENDLVVIHGNE